MLSQPVLDAAHQTLASERSMLEVLTQTVQQKATMIAELERENQALKINHQSKSPKLERSRYLLVEQVDCPETKPLTSVTLTIHLFLSH